jgi:DNA-binding PadR family transcriptional regulator
MTSVVHWTVLSLVIERASYGHELFKRYLRMYGDVLPISEASHIYASLNELERRGYVREVQAPRAILKGVGRQPKSHYQATPAGVRSYIDWLVEQADVERKHQALWVRQLAIFADEPAAALHVLGRARSQYLQGTGIAGDRSPAPGSREALSGELVARHQREAGGGMLSWLKYAIATFEARRDDAART